MDLQTVEIKLSKITNDAHARINVAQKEGRQLTEVEEKAHEADLNSMEDLSRQRAKLKGDAEVMSRIDELTGGYNGNGRNIKSIGAQVTESSTLGKWLVETKGNRSSNFESPSVEVKVLSEDGSGLIIPQFVPPNAPPLPPSIVDLMAVGNTEMTAISYMQEGASVNAAAPVAEGATKPESTLVLTNLTNPLRKVAHWLPVTEEILDDVPAMRGYVDTRLRQGVMVKLDSQVLNGDNVAPNMAGILNTPGLTPPLPQGAMTALDAILTQASAVYVASGLRPDGVVLNPTDNLIFQLAKATDGTYLGALEILQNAGLRVAVSPAMAVGTALVGNFRTGTQLWIKGGLRIKVSDSHQDYFIKNLLAIVAEIRAAVTLYIPKSFGVVNGLTATPIA